MKDITSFVSQAIKEPFLHLWLRVQHAGTAPEVTCKYQPKQKPKMAYSPRFTFEQGGCLCGIFRKFWTKHSEDGSGPWTTLTLVIEPTGEVAFHFDYDELSPERFITDLDAWKAKFVPGLRIKSIDLRPPNERL